MDFDSKAQLFRLSSQEADILRIHPAWMECRRQDVLKLFALVSRSIQINLEMHGDAYERSEEAARQFTAYQIGKGLLAQLEPFVEADISALTAELPNSLPDLSE